ncbi:MAG: hypothetical protein EHM41_23325 [Chloroflexi bacterium]|nr:MAG: hypothetical protein EHM41_23325 [Chloroflexota bacterium]
MNTFWLFAVPSLLVITGMILNNFQVVFDRPQYSLEEDPAKKLSAERRFFDLQRVRFLKRQKRVGQYAWLVLVAFIAFSWWLYLDTVDKTTASKQITAIQTLPVVESEDMVLSLTLSDGNTVQYLIKSPTLTLTLSDGDTQYIKLPNAKTPRVTGKEGLSNEAVQGWRLTSLGTALSIGDVGVPLGIALNISK